jgi:hypothetical protein
MISQNIKIGARVELLSPMTNGPDSVIPFETGMDVGLQGTVVWVSADGPSDYHQLGVAWDNGRTLNLTNRDCFKVLA